MDSLESKICKLSEHFQNVRKNSGVYPEHLKSVLSFKDTKKAIDEFFVDKSGVLQKLPTGQAIYYR